MNQTFIQAKLSLEFFGYKEHYQDMWQLDSRRPYGIVLSQKNNGCEISMFDMSRATCGQPYFVDTPEKAIAIIKFAIKNICILHD